MRKELPEKLNFAVVIFARDESSVISKTIDQVHKALKSQGTVYVVADNCTDDTAQVAQHAGAVVLSKDTPRCSAKGDAIAWFMHNSQSAILEYDYIVILDADSLIPEDFFANLSHLKAHDILAAQCRLSPITDKDTGLLGLIALSEHIENIVFDRTRSSLGLPVRLRGTGMVFAPLVLLRICSRVATEVEDISLTLLLAEEKTRIHWLKNAVVYDPKPGNHAAASRQRARWFRGQWSAFWRYRSIVLRLMARGPAGWSILSSLFLKPRWLKWLILAILTFIFSRQSIISIPILIYLGVEIVLTLVGMFALPNRGSVLRSLLSIPRFILMWMKGIFLSFSRTPWLRVRETGNFDVDGRPDASPFTKCLSRHTE